MKLVTASDLEMRALDWLWYGRFPSGQCSLIEGDPGTSKSTLCCTMAAHVSLGKDWPDGELCPKGHVIIANAEDPEREIILPRLVAAKADLAKISIVIPSEEGDSSIFTIPDHVDNLKKVIVNLGVKLIVFDPLEAFLSDKVNNYSNHHVRKALRSLEQMAKEVNCAVIIVRHLNKDVGKTAIYRGGGSIGIIGAARASTLVSKDPANKERCLMVPNKSNWASIRDGIAYRTVNTELTSPLGEVIKTSRIVWDGEVPLTANEVLQPSTDVTEMSDLHDTAEFLRNALKDGPKASSEIFNEAVQQGISKKTVYRAAKMINVLKRPEGNGDSKKWVWELECDITSEFLEDM